MPIKKTPPLRKSASASKPVKKPAATVKKPVAKKTAVKKTKPVAKPAKKIMPAKKAAPVKKPVSKKKVVTQKMASAKKPVKKPAPKLSKDPGSHAKSPVGRQLPSTAKPVAKPVVKKTASKLSNDTGSRATDRAGRQPIASSPAFMAHLSTMGVPPYTEKPGEEYMNPQQLNHFRHILNLWKQGLMEEVDRTVHHMQDESANFPDPNDRATQEEEFSLELRARDRERKLIKKINEALNSMEQDNYGYCDTCGIEIGIRRLEARPTATLCIDCKTLAEIKERQMGSFSD